MRLRLLLAIGSIFLFLLVSAHPATAGGWATIELDQPVTNAVVGEEVELSILVLQHGVTPVSYDDVRITATHPESDTTIDTMADPGEGPMTGHYTARLTFTEPGRWTLDAEELEFGFKSSFPTLHVVGADDQNGDADPEPASTTIRGEIVEIEIIGASFAPALVEIKAGTTVSWTNQDPIKHEIAFADGLIDDSGILDPTSSFTYTFEESGTYTFLCGPHPGMSGQIVVI